MVEVDPYPHVVLDGALPEDERRLLIESWPALTAFGEEIPGNTALWMNTVAPPHEWRSFLPARIEELTRTLLVKFAPWTTSRLGQDIGPLTVHSCVMEARSDFSGHRIHNHHYHSPNWVTTALIHLDEDAGGFDGTVINRLDGDPIDAFTHTALWDDHPGFSEHATVEYNPGRMFALADGPISYHSSHRPELGALGSRRMLRFHVAAPWSICEALYGISEAEYCDLHPAHEVATDPRVRIWAKRDIDALANPTAISVEEAEIWANEIEIVVPIAAT